MAKRILYVEDHLNNMLLLKRIVQAEGHEFLHAKDAAAGWQAAVACRPDLIFLDLRLPGPVDGLGLLRRLKADPATGQIPVIVLTAYGDWENEQRARAAGSDDFLAKPADIHHIRLAIRTHTGTPAGPPRPLPLSHWAYDLIHGA
ncbi:MAG: response regulator [Candidatus Promineifilaceae bacterium]